MSRRVVVMIAIALAGAMFALVAGVVALVWWQQVAGMGGDGVSMVFAVVPETSTDIPAAALSSVAIKQVERRVSGALGGRVRVTDAGPGRVQVWMPYSKASQAAFAEYMTTRRAFESTTLNMNGVNGILKLSGAERKSAMDTMFAPGSKRHSLLESLASAQDDLMAVEHDESQHRADKVPTETWAQDQRARDTVAHAQTDLTQESLSEASFEELLKSDESGDRAAVLGLSSIAGRYPDQQSAIDAVVAAHEKLMIVSDRKATPEDVATLVLPSDEMEFRIVVMKDEMKEGGIEEAGEVLAKSGVKGSVDVGGGIGARWFEIKSSRGSVVERKTSVTKLLDPSEYVLLYDTPTKEMTHEKIFHDWMISASSPYNDGHEWELPFMLDPVGGAYMGSLTADERGHAMAIVVGGKVISAPNINTRIDDAGMISFGTSGGHAREDAEPLKTVVNNGSYPGAGLRFEQVK